MSFWTKQKQQKFKLYFAASSEKLYSIGRTLSSRAPLKTALGWRGARRLVFRGEVGLHSVEVLLTIVHFHRKLYSILSLNT